MKKQFAEFIDHIREINSYQRTNDEIFKELVRFLQRCPKGSPDYRRGVELISSLSTDVCIAQAQKKRIIELQNKFLSKNITG